MGGFLGPREAIGDVVVWKRIAVYDTNDKT